MTAPIARPAAARADETRPTPPPQRDTWLLQRVAAATAGCSVSAIRKWRRLGLVADRTRISPGGMRRVEVRLEDVLARMQTSMTPPRGPNRPAPPPDPTPAGVALVSIGDLDVFVQRIADAERRAARAGAQSRAKDAVIEFLRERVAELEGQVTATTDQRRNGAASSSHPALDPRPLTAEIRRLRSRFQATRSRGTGEDSDRRNAIRRTYDTALLCLCLGAGIPHTAKLGDTLTDTERTRLGRALLEAGFDIVD